MAIDPYTTAAELAMQQKEAQGQAVAGLTGQATGMIANALDPNARAVRKELKKDRARLEARDLGPSQGEKLAQAARLARQRMAASSGVDQQLDREAAAQGFDRSGGQNNARVALAAQREAGAASDMGAIEGQAIQAALAEKSSILARLKQQGMEAVQRWADLGTSVGAVAAGVKPPESKVGDTIQGTAETAEQQRLREMEAARQAAAAARLAPMQ